LGYKRVGDDTKKTNIPKNLKEMAKNY